MTKTRFQQLSEQIIDLSAELNREAVASDPNLWAETRSHEAAKRAIAVAAVAHESILFIGPEADLCVMLAAQAGVASQTFAVKDLANADEMRSLSLAMKKHAIHCEAPLSPAKGNTFRATNLEETIRHVEAARTTLATAPAGDVLDDRARTILGVACREIGIPELRRRTILRVARAIAALGNRATIQAEDVCEAVNYFLDRK
jgi:predicted ATPase with chaperone activity